jgi:hypothetical protein
MLIPAYVRRRDDDVLELPGLGSKASKLRQLILKHSMVGVKESSFFFKAAKYKDDNSSKTSISDPDEDNAIFRFDEEEVEED